MKRFINVLAVIVLSLVFVVQIAQAETKLTVSGEFELGGDMESYSNGVYNSFLDLELGLNLYVDWFKWTAYVGSRTWFELGFPSDKLITGYPFREIYLYGTRFNFYTSKSRKNDSHFFIEIQHFCNHAVYSSSIHNINGIDIYEVNGPYVNFIDYKDKTYAAVSKKWWSNAWGETMTTISIGYKFEVPVWEKI